MAGYKLYYFDARAKGEKCRLALAAAKIDFEDVRFKVSLTGEESEEWAKEKASGRPPLGQMPFLVAPEGKILGQSGAIMKYICRKAGLCPEDSFDEALADMIHDATDDLRNAVIKFFFEKDEAKKAGLEKEYNETTLPARLEKFEALLKSRDEGKGFFLGDKLTYADISFFDFFNGYIAGGQPTIPKELQKFPLLAEHYNRVLNVPEIKTWIAKRPASFF
ncbi:hypothetical protein ABFA07_015001 [Porites harrisoni]